MLQAGATGKNHQPICRLAILLCLFIYLFMYHLTILSIVQIIQNRKQAVTAATLWILLGEISGSNLGLSLDYPH
jgi:hypothetical protein